MTDPTNLRQRHITREKKKDNPGKLCNGSTPSEKSPPDGPYFLCPNSPERVCVGHAEMARNIPLLFVKHEWNAETNQFAVEPNPDFISEAKCLFMPTDTLLVMCRSDRRRDGGQRSGKEGL